MSRRLHDSHRWDESGDVAVCIACRVEGYEDESAAFRPCRPPKVCWATMESTYLPGHTHLCETAPHDGDHICADCGRRFFKR